MKINCSVAERVLVSFIRHQMATAGYSRAIIGLSGGLDSTVSAFLGVKALGKNNLVAMILPYGRQQAEDEADAKHIVKRLGIASRTIDISPMVDAYYSKYPIENRIVKGNKMARERMSILFDYSEREKALVLGTSNKTELLLGYGTIYGDMASAFNPLGDLYKTQVRQMAAHLGVPEKIIDKTPSAGLWPGQTDEGELGMSYDQIDAVLFELVDQKKSKEEVIEAGHNRKTVLAILEMIKQSEFKRKLPVIAKLSERTIGLDFLYPYDRDDEPG